MGHGGRGARLMTNREFPAAALKGAALARAVYILCGLLTCGCVHARLTRAKELQSVRVLLDPDVELTSRSSEDDCRAHEQAEKRALLDSLRTGLSTIGFQVVGARSEAHEAVAHVAESCTSATSGETWRRVTVVLDPGRQGDLRLDLRRALGARERRPGARAWPRKNRGPGPEHARGSEPAARLRFPTTGRLRRRDRRRELLRHSRTSRRAR